MSGISRAAQQLLLVGEDAGAAPSDALARLVRGRGAVSQQASVSASLALDAQPAGAAGGLAAQLHARNLLRTWKGDSHFPGRLSAATELVVQLVRRPGTPLRGGLSRARSDAIAAMTLEG